MDTALRTHLDEIEARLAEILEVLKDIRMQGQSDLVTDSEYPPNLDHFGMLL